MPLDIHYTATAAEKRLIYLDGDADTQLLKGSTPEQIATYVQTNVTDLDSAKVLLTRILIVMAGQIR